MSSVIHRLLIQPELYPDLIAMVRSHTFFGVINAEPYNHLQEFEDMCSFLVIPGMT
jgi:hypothetical protein